MQNLIPYKVYTDGSARRLGNGYCGGWAYCILYDSDMIKSDSGNELNSTNQRMEMLSIIKALEYIQSIKKPKDECYIYSDSAYIINCKNNFWYRNWMRNGWITSTKKGVSNIDLWVKLIPFFENKNYYFFKVKGHENDYYNNYVDKMAQEQSLQLFINEEGRENVQ